MMAVTAYIGPFLIGVILIVLGMANRKGNISSLHFYHRHRVAEQDRLPFGKMVGLGTILCGSGIVAFSIFSAVAMYTEQPFWVLIGTGILLAGLAIGLVISFRAMIRYNKGIF